MQCKEGDDHIQMNIGSRFCELIILQKMKQLYFIPQALLWKAQCFYSPSDLDKGTTPWWLQACDHNKSLVWLPRAAQHE